MKNRTIENDEGNALLIVIGIIGLLSIIGTIVFSVGRASVEQTTVNRATVQARATAESGLDYLAAMLSEKRGHDGTVQTDIVAACNSWLSNPSSLTRAVGNASDPDGTYKVTIQTASALDGTWSNNCNGSYLRLISTGTAADKGAGTKRGSTAKMISTFELPAGTPGTPGEDGPPAGLWDYSGNEDVYRPVDTNNAKFNANTPTIFTDPATGGKWVRVISDFNGNNKGTAKSFWQNGYMLLKQPFSTDEDLTVDFDYRIYNKLSTNIDSYGFGSGTGSKMSGDLGTGDGFSFFFVNAANAPTKPGAFGAGLGYAPAANQGGPFAPLTPGIKGGYLGIGVDAYGNYQKAEPSDKDNCSDLGGIGYILNDHGSIEIPGGATRSSTIFKCITGNDSIRAGNPDADAMRELKPNSISIRGAGNSDLTLTTPYATNGGQSHSVDTWRKAYGFANDNTGGYRWLAGTRKNLNDLSGDAGRVYNRFDDPLKTDKYRHVRFIMKKVSSNQHDVQLWVSKKIFSSSDPYDPKKYNQTGSDSDWIKFSIPHIQQDSPLKNGGKIPSEIRYGIAASSGWASATVEIGNLALESGGEIIEPLKGTEGALGTLLSKNDLLQ